MQVGRPKTTTIAVDVETSLKIERLCKMYEIQKKDFCRLAVDYFLRTGIDPKSNDTEQNMSEIRESLAQMQKTIAEERTERSLERQERVLDRKNTELATKQNETNFKMLQGLIQDTATAIGIIQQAAQEQQRLIEAQNQTIDEVKEQTRPTYTKRTWYGAKKTYYKDNDEEVQ